MSGLINSNYLFPSSSSFDGLSKIILSQGKVWLRVEARLHLRVAMELRGYNVFRARDVRVYEACQGSRTCYLAVEGAATSR